MGLRRHPRKSKHLIIAKYILTSGDTVDFTAGEGRKVQLFRAARVSIERHTKVKETAPFDPEWEPYLSAFGVKMAAPECTTPRCVVESTDGFCRSASEDHVTGVAHHQCVAPRWGTRSETNPCCSSHLHQQVPSQKMTKEAASGKGGEG